MTALYRLGDAPSKKLVPTTQMRFGSITPAAKAMEYVRRREDAGDFSVVGFCPVGDPSDRRRGLGARSR